MLRAALRSTISWLPALAITMGAGCASSEPATVVLEPGQDLQEIVADAPPGTRFVLEPGIYRQQTIYPNDRQEFIGQEGVILSGAMELTSWTKGEGFWASERLPAPLRFHGECKEGHELCTRREDLFFNGRVYQRARLLDELGPGKWYYGEGRAHLAEDPRGQSVELGVTPLAFGGDAEDVVLQDLIVERYASDSQEGAIDLDETRGWLIANVTARWNHGAGLSFGPQTHVSGGSFSHNGQIGIVGIGEDVKIEGVEIAFNNYSGYDPMWEAGGTKFWETKDLLVRDSCIHDNGGPGLWTDNDNIGTIYDGNKVFMNANDGIKHEISYDAIIRDNIVAHNGTSGFDDWLWGSQILIQDSSNVQVHDNVVEVSSEFGNGIGVIYQDRGDGAYGPWRAFGNSVQYNTIVYLGARGQSGVVTDTDDNRFWSDSDNTFDGNSYVVADRRSEYWTSNDRDAIWDDLEDLGFERNGKLIVAQRTPMELSCN